MPTFYFHIDDGVEAQRDKFGVELASLSDARREAAVLIGDLIRDRPDMFWATNEWALTVEDDDGLVLFMIHLAATAAPAIIHQLRA